MSTRRRIVNAFGWGFVAGFVFAAFADFKREQSTATATYTWRPEEGWVPEDQGVRAAAPAP